jgi:hypothetical protein
MSEHDTKAHSTFGGSSADRWMNCAGSTALCATVPEPPTSKYAAEGTAAHALAEHCLKNGETDAHLHVGEWFPLELPVPERPRFEVTTEMATAVQVYLDTVYAELAKAPDSQLYVEQRFVLPIATAEPGEVFGSNDAMVYSPSLARLVVFDYKHGAGVSVSAEDSSQLKFYGSGAAMSHPEWAIASVELVIVQPRARDADDSEEPGVKRWEMDPLELIEFAGEAEAAIAAAKREMQKYAEDPKASLSLNPSPTKDGWCKWCNAAAICPAREQQALRASGLDYADVTVITPEVLPKPDTLDTARLGQVLAALDIIEQWGGQVRAYVDGLLQQGVPVPGWKLVDKVGRRKWIEDEKRIADYLSVMHGLDEDDIRPRKLVTITEAERQLKAVVTDKDERKKALEDLSLAFTLKDSSGLTLVPASDKRPAVDALSRDYGSINITA